MLRCELSIVVQVGTMVLMPAPFFNVTLDNVYVYIT
jgi:hypothetical protein